MRGNFRIEEEDVLVEDIKLLLDMNGNYIVADDTNNDWASNACGDSSNKPLLNSDVEMNEHK